MAAFDLFYICVIIVRYAAGQFCIAAIYGNSIPIRKLSFNADYSYRKKARSLLEDGFTASLIHINSSFNSGTDNDIALLQLRVDIFSIEKRA